MGPFKHLMLWLSLLSAVTLGFTAGMAFVVADRACADVPTTYEQAAEQILDWTEGARVHSYTNTERCQVALAYRRQREWNCPVVVHWYRPPQSGWVVYRLRINEREAWILSAYTATANPWRR